MMQYTVVCNLLQHVQMPYYMYFHVSQAKEQMKYTGSLVGKFYYLHNTL